MEFFAIAPNGNELFFRLLHRATLPCYRLPTARPTPLQLSSLFCDKPSQPGKPVRRRPKPTASTLRRESIHSTTLRSIQLAPQAARSNTVPATQSNSPPLLPNSIRARSCTLSSRLRAANGESGRRSHRPIVMHRHRSAIAAPTQQSRRRTEFTGGDLNERSCCWRCRPRRTQRRRRLDQSHAGSTARLWICRARSSWRKGRAMRAA